MSKEAEDKMTIFVDTEEMCIEENISHAKLYCYRNDAFSLAGAEVSREAVNFDPSVVEDREIITGQNPRSDKPIAAKLIQALERVPVTA